LIVLGSEEGRIKRPASLKFQSKKKRDEKEKEEGRKDGGGGGTS